MESFVRENSVQNCRHLICSKNKNKNCAQKKSADFGVRYHSPEFVLHQVIVRIAIRSHIYSWLWELKHSALSCTIHIAPYILSTNCAFRKQKSITSEENGNLAHTLLVLTRVKTLVHIARIRYRVNRNAYLPDRPNFVF